ncbi:MAG: hypothetical protein PHY54_15020 [Methylococcales bacterium]|nr:hypothetical protein [Methylococcales bacterium]
MPGIIVHGMDAYGRFTLLTSCLLLTNIPVLAHFKTSASGIHTGKLKLDAALLEVREHRI